MLLRIEIVSAVGVAGDQLGAIGTRRQTVASIQKVSRLTTFRKGSRYTIALLLLAKSARGPIVTPVE
ncbi:uncharacterized protein METZ01_LOCUS435851 [marine metagenome]|uniref:Uncharacterized protein n=1 Tax=marine metagenome TaxID=408172 RepID=A0A382YI62_9ZZZZ